VIKEEGKKEKGAGPKERVSVTSLCFSSSQQSQRVFHLVDSSSHPVVRLFFYFGRGVLDHV
jgi:hypothetical protein